MRLRVEDDRSAGVRVDEQINAMAFLQNVPPDSFFGSEGVSYKVHSIINLPNAMSRKGHVNENFVNNRTSTGSTQVDARAFLEIIIHN
jgi:hypothetical protein